MQDKDLPVLVHGPHSSSSLQPSAEKALTKDGQSYQNTMAARKGEPRSGSTVFLQEHWEEWLHWDGGAESLSPQSSPRGSLDLKDSDQSSSPTRTQGFLAQNDAKLNSQRKHHPISKKRKQYSDGNGSSKAGDGKSNRPSGSQRSHTIIEKRYRTNLNDKIAELRESVPSLRTDELNSADVGSLTIAKLNKATVFSKAVEYIQSLEKRNNSLERENAQLRCRKGSSQRETNNVNDFQELNVRASTERGSSQSLSLAHQGTSQSAHSVNAPEGIIPVPENMKRLRPTMPQEHYAGRLESASEQDGYLADEAHILQHTGTDRGRFISKIMLGSLAGLLIIEGLMKNEKDGHDPDGRGLWALSHPSYSHADFSQWAPQMSLLSSHFLSTSSILKAFLGFSILALALFIYLFSAKPTPSKKLASVALAAAPSLAAPIEVRQKAWLTSIQTVWVPRHKMLPELIALHLEASKYLLRLAIGWSGYAWLTGTTEEDEAARIKAWDIAIDAQLAGGDAEVSKSRLVLTVWASGTLPRTPARLMLKALHIRIMFWEASRLGWNMRCLLHKIASQLASHQWVLAQKLSEMQKPRQSTPQVSTDSLPPHFSALLRLDSDEIFTDRIVQRAYNLTWNRPTQEDTDDQDLGVDFVVEDCAIRSPLDALAAWASNFTLQQALHAWYSKDCLLSESHRSQIQLALDLAPPGSCAYVRALAAKTIFFDISRNSNISKLLHEMIPSKLNSVGNGNKTQHKSTFVDSSIPEIIRNDINAIRKCAISIESLTCHNHTLRECYKAVETLLIIFVNADSLSFLGFTASHQLFRVLVDQAINKEIAGRLKYIRNLLKIWINDPVERKIPLDPRERTMLTAALDRVLIKESAKRRFAEASNDTGYESMSEPDGLV